MDAPGLALALALIPERRDRVKRCRKQAVKAAEKLSTPAPKGRADTLNAALDLLRQRCLRCGRCDGVSAVRPAADNVVAIR